ncbi:ABC transporter substrate-binding protein [Microbacterium sp. H1-D42]|uniref:heme/hemin ABC transporter substrate-binding protein n=1 Tax=Microbacterium sp. H1-D42 TaxID=2925844 RepID=UPI001F53681B|nr:ABC transporter substrate-binding protein [Microbacterium sp. H1-D42]UNK70039.1 ABC transporter substrate-binding protein [Microbacterium sp. H1-D42]
MRGAHPLAAALGGILLAFTLVACQGAAAQNPSTPTEVASVDLPPLSELTAVDDPSAITGPSTVVIGDSSLDGIAAAEPNLPSTVTSVDGHGSREVAVTDTSRIIALSLSGTVAELVDALGFGDRLVGRDIATDLPGRGDLPVVTKKGHTIDAEGVLALNPTLILTDGSIGPTDVVLQLGDAGIPVVTVPRATDPDSTFQTIHAIANALGVTDSADELIDGLAAAIEQKRTEIARLLPADEKLLPRVAFLYVRGTAGIYYLFGSGSGADSLISSVGAIDVASEIGWQGERPMTPEALIEIDPDVILVMTKGLESAGGIDGLLEAQPSIALTKAGENRRIVDAADTEIFAGGTRIPDIMDGLARALYAPDSLPPSTH